MRYNYQDDKFYSELGERLISRRKQTLRYSQEKLIGKLINNTEGRIGRNSLSNAENGNFSKLTLKQFLCICDVLECKAGHLLGEYMESSDDYHYICNKTKLTETAVDKLCSWGNSEVPFFEQFARFYSAFICDFTMTGVLGASMGQYYKIKKSGVPEDSEFLNNDEALKFYKTQIADAIYDFVTRFFENEFNEENQEQGEGEK